MQGRDDGQSRTVAWAVAGAAGLAGVLAVRGARRARRRRALAGKVVLITGGSRGLGLVLAREAADAGARISICARDELELERARRELEERGAEVVAFTCDVARREQVEEWVARSRSALGPVDVLINNASVIQVGPLEAMAVEDFEEAMAVNFWGTVYATYAVLRDMRRRGDGRIANITSIGGKVAIPHLMPYDVAKFAAVGFSEGLRSELAGSGVTVTTVVPGLMRTGSPSNAFFKGNRAAEFTWFSLGDATPVTAVSARRAARRILDATQRGRAEVTLTWQAKLLRLGHDLFPGLTADLLGVVNRLLPEHQPGEEAPVRGMRLATRASPSPVTGLMNRAARRNNEYGGAPLPSARHAEQANVWRGP